MPTDFEHIYEEHKNLVFNLALHYVQNIEDAEEITQDVFVSVYDKLNEFRQESKHATWLYRITINKSLDYLKAKKRKKRFGIITPLFDASPNHFQAVESNHPGALLEHKQALNHLFERINRLPDKQKTALILLKIEGKSQSEAAQIMNITSKAVESLMSRAKENLSKKKHQTKENE